MSRWRQIVQHIFVAWLVFLLAGVPIPVTHCHAFEIGNDQSSQGLRVHLCDCAHDATANDENDPWHLHWICFHFTDELASLSSSAHVDVVSNATMLELGFRKNRFPYLDGEKEFSVWLSQSDSFDVDIRRFESSCFALSQVRNAKSHTDYCATSSRLLL
jgi:hypothetical protein